MTILWRHVSNTEMFSRSQEHKTSVSRPVLPFSAQCAVAFDVNGVVGARFRHHWGRGKKKKKKPSLIVFDSLPRAKTGYRGGRWVGRCVVRKRCADLCGVPDDPTG